MLNTTESASGLHLGASFADALPELALPWEAMRPEQPELLRLNTDLARELGLDPARLAGEAGVRALLGNALPEGARPVAQVYAGHQFGVFVPRLGDGRALLLGEVADAAGRVRDVHLKGSGRTPFARADGFGAVGPMLREYVMGEAMHALGIPTSRALAVVGTGQRVRREVRPLPGAVLVRVASSHLRVGTFQYALTSGDSELLRRLADFAIARHFPAAGEREDRYAALLEAVVDAQAELVAKWMLVGFVHGVMNTDNTFLSGETLDYGPCAFLDVYDPTTVFSSIDSMGRYAYGNQPRIAVWNLSRFAETLLPLLADDPETGVGIAEAAVGRFQATYDAAWTAGMRAKLGLSAAGAAPDGETARDIASGLLSDLQTYRVDFTESFRALARAARGDRDAVRSLFPEGAEPGEWLETWLSLGPDGDAMDRVNPVYIPRNLLVDEALDAATDGDPEPLDRLLEAVTRPFEERPGLERYAQGAPAGSWPHVTYCGT